MCGSGDLKVLVGMIYGDADTISLGYQDCGVTPFRRFIAYGGNDALLYQGVEFCFCLLPKGE